MLKDNAGVFVHGNQSDEWHVRKAVFSSQEHQR